MRQRVAMHTLGGEFLLGDHDVLPALNPGKQSAVALDAVVNEIAQGL